MLPENANWQKVLSSWKVPGVAHLLGRLRFQLSKKKREIQVLASVCVSVCLSQLLGCRSRPRILRTRAWMKVYRERTWLYKPSTSSSFLCRASPKPAAMSLFSCIHTTRTQTQKEMNNNEGVDILCFFHECASWSIWVCNMYTALPGLSLAGWRETNWVHGRYLLATRQMSLWKIHFSFTVLQPGTETIENIAVDLNTAVVKSRMCRDGYRNSVLFFVPTEFAPKYQVSIHVKSNSATFRYLNAPSCRVSLAVVREDDVTAVKLSDVSLTCFVIALVRVCRVRWCVCGRGTRWNTE